MLRETLREPRRDFCIVIAGIAISHLLQHDADDGSDESRAIHELRNFKTVAPSSADTFLGDGDVATSAERDVDARGPIARCIEIGAECLLDAFTGNDEQGWFEFEKFWVCVRRGAALRGHRAAPVNDDELPGSASHDAAGVGERCLRGQRISREEQYSEREESFHGGDGLTTKHTKLGTKGNQLIAVQGQQAAIISHTKPGTYREPRRFCSAFVWFVVQKFFSLQPPVTFSRQLWRVWFLF